MWYLYYLCLQQQWLMIIIQLLDHVSADKDLPALCAVSNLAIAVVTQEGWKAHWEAEPYYLVNHHYCNLASLTSCMLVQAAQEHMKTINDLELEIFCLLGLGSLKCLATYQREEYFKKVMICFSELESNLNSVSYYY